MSLSHFSILYFVHFICIVFSRTKTVQVRDKNDVTEVLTWGDINIYSRNNLTSIFISCIITGKDISLSDHKRTTDISNSEQTLVTVNKKPLGLSCISFWRTWVRGPAPLLIAVSCHCTSWEAAGDGESTRVLYRYWLLAVTRPSSACYMYLGNEAANKDTFVRHLSLIFFLPFK